MSKRVILVLAVVVSLLCFVGLAVSQPGGGAGQGGGRGQGMGGGMGMGMGMGMGRGGFGGVNAATCRQVLGMTEQQWEPINAKFEKVRQLMTDSRVTITPMSGRRGRGEDAAPADSAPQWMRPSQRAQMSGQALTEGEKAAEALLDLVEKKDSDVKQVQQKVEALRAIRKKAQADLATAQADLRKAVDERQAAMLTLMGILD
ncbi:MAG: hypothetical protein KBE04_02365 [Phycisphaerae bacterium]|nr:hypothetical protein [Phycisphaerae bacterium]